MTRSSPGRPNCGSITFSAYKRIEAEYRAPRLFNRRGVLSVLGGWREATDVGFYGIGTPSTSIDDRANYSFRQPYLAADLEVRPTRRTLLVGGGFGEVGEARNLSWWYLTGGVLGAVYVTTALIAVKTLGAGGVTAATIAGQLTLSLILDKTGALGLEGRAGYYDGTGALRDMIQSHLLAVLALVAMDPIDRVDEVVLRDAIAGVLRDTAVWGDDPVVAIRSEGP